jgi:hypothetical protein
LTRGLRSRYNDSERECYALLRVLNKKGRKIDDETSDTGEPTAPLKSVACLEKV